MMQGTGCRGQVAGVEDGGAVCGNPEIATPMRGNDSQRCRELRRLIQAHRIKRLGWSDFVFHYVMEGLGFGRSLKALDEARLEGLWEIVKGYRKSGKPVEFTYDKQGRYMHVLMKQAGWEEHTLRAYLTITYKKTHWNLLDKDERRKVIDQLKECAKEVQKNDSNN